MDDTITAIATPMGEGGLGVVRISGRNSMPIALEIFKPFRMKGELESHRLYFGRIGTGTESIDEACLVYMKEPRSYTRQDTVELSCHGSPAVLRRVLKLVMEKGARMAEPGEFTRRAFLNGRIDLSQAEGVIDLINARSEGAAKAAFAIMEGGLSERIEAVKQRLVKILSHLEASIDFPEDELETEGNEELLHHLEDAEHRMERLIKSYDAGRLLKKGMGLAIIGKPNVGKSSLLNALLEEERAIVTGHPGTTRDLIHANTEIAGLSVELVDTAGLNSDPGEVEKEGIKRALKAAQTADAVIGVFDGSREWEESDDTVLELLKKAERFAAVINKSDLHKKIDWPDKSIEPICISAKERTGMDSLLKRISELAGDRGTFAEEPVVTRTRHLEIFRRIAEDLKRAREDISVGREVAAMNIWEALEEIKRFTGESYTEEVLSKIFDEFCVGK